MKTLYDTISDKAAFETAVFNAVHKALLDLGPKIRDLDWANVSVSAKARAQHSPASSRF